MASKASIKRLKKRQSAFIYTIHRNADSGPSRTLYDPIEAKSYFKDMYNRYLKDEPIIKVKHKKTGLTYITDTQFNLDWYLTNIVKRVQELYDYNGNYIGRN